MFSRIDSTLCFFGISFSFLLDWLWFLCKIIEAVDKLFSEESFVLTEAVLLTTESCGFDVLDFELNASGGYGGDVYIEIISHKIIITAQTSQMTVFNDYLMSLNVVVR